MTKTQVLDGIARLGLVPVIRAQSQDDAIRVIDAIREGGINVLEITMTVPGAVSVMKAVSTRFGSDVIVGAGTVLDPDTASACLDAGAQFIVSPAVDLATIERCRLHDVAVMPGALTPTEVVTAWRAGADVVKVFPCSAVGGASYLKALKAPLPQIALMPTGGVSLKTAADFIVAGAFALGVGADLVDLTAIRDGRAAQITDRAREYVRIVRDARATLAG
jgi:2-dehydro-3-deoxyphosphogluconate aldolase/(4S)-4-hydroxy-2-oxoglutarate aldolase